MMFETGTFEGRVQRSFVQYGRIEFFRDILLTAYSVEQLLVWIRGK